MVPDPSIPMLALAVASGLLIGTITAPAGVSGAVLLLPIQVVAFGVPPLVATTTSLLYNVLAIPLGAWGFARRGRVDWRIVGILTRWAVPAVLIGVAIRASLLRDASWFLPIAAAVLLYVGVGLLVDRSRDVRRTGIPSDRALAGASAWSGAIGGVYGIGGGALAAPWLAMRGFDPRLLAGSMLVMTWASSVAATIAFAGIELATGIGTIPLVELAIAFAIGGAAGTAIGARLHVPVRVARRVLGVVAAASGLRLLAQLALGA
jgi:uncharacterized protein